MSATPARAKAENRLEELNREIAKLEKDQDNYMRMVQLIEIRIDCLKIEMDKLAWGVR